MLGSNAYERIGEPNKDSDKTMERTIKLSILSDLDSTLATQLRDAFHFLKETTDYLNFKL
jgi:hypothetical protein